MLHLNRLARLAALENWVVELQWMRKDTEKIYGRQGGVGATDKLIRELQGLRNAML